MQRALVFVIVVATYASVLGCAPTSASPSSTRAARTPPRETAAPSAPSRADELAEVATAPADDTPLVYEEVVTGGAAAEDALPLVVGIHGFGDSPAGVRPMAERFSGRARFVLPRAPTPYGPGFAWFPYYAGRGTPQQYADGVSAAALRVAALIRQVRATRPTRGKTVVTGFSQGGMISYALAAQHGELVDAAIPMAGFLPAPLLPTSARGIPPIRAMHGDADDVVPLARDEESVGALRALGVDIALRTYPGVRHTMTEPMRDDLSAAIAEALAR